MNPYIKNPKILLLKCSIEYLYREETKFTCIDPIVLQVTASSPYMISVNVICKLSSENTLKIQESEKLFHFAICAFQEHEFLKNYVQRIADVRPNLVLVEKTVSRIAQDMLLEHGISLVINVKPVSTFSKALFKYYSSFQKCTPHCCPLIMP